jgi:hypothetical protein
MWYTVSEVVSSISMNFSFSIKQWLFYSIYLILNCSIMIFSSQRSLNVFQPSVSSYIVHPYNSLVFLCLGLCNFIAYMNFSAFSNRLKETLMQLWSFFCPLVPYLPNSYFLNCHKFLSVFSTQGNWHTFGGIFSLFKESQRPIRQKPQKS